MKTFRTRFMIEFTDKIETVNYVCYLNKTTLLALCYVGKAVKPAFYYKYRTVEQMYNSVKEYLERYDNYFRAKAEAKAKQKELQANFEIQKYLKIGDIIQNTWGYDQTNQFFYQVTGFIGRTKIQVKELAQKYTDRETGNDMAAYTMPVKDNFLKDGDSYTLTCKAYEHEPFFHICSPAGSSFYYFHKWDGREAYVSWYA